MERGREKNRERKREMKRAQHSSAGCPQLSRRGCANHDTISLFSGTPLPVMLVSRVLRLRALHANWPMADDGEGYLASQMTALLVFKL